MRSLTWQRKRRTSGPENFQSQAKKDFFNTICQEETLCTAIKDRYRTENPATTASLTRAQLCNGNGLPCLLLGSGDRGSDAIERYGKCSTLRVLAVDWTDCDLKFFWEASMQSRSFLNWCFRILASGRLFGKFVKNSRENLK